MNPASLDNNESFGGTMRGIFVLMGPILFTQYAQIANAVVDTLMCGHLDTRALAAVGLAVAVWVPMQAFLVGILFGLLVELAQLFGQGNKGDIPWTTQQAGWLGFGLSGAMALAIVWIAYSLDLFGMPAELHALVKEYLLGLAWGFPFCGLFFALRYYCEGQGAPRAITYISVGAVFANALLNYGLMFGGFGLPALGLKGCGISTAICWVGSFVATAVYVSLARHFEDVRIFSRMYVPKIGRMFGLFRTGLPIGISFLSEFLVLAFMTLMIGRLGTLAVAGHQITYNFSLVLFTLPVSLSIALSIVIGHARGAGNRAAEQRTVRAGMLLATCMGAGLTLLLWSIAGQVPYLYTDNAEVVAVTVALLHLAALFQLADSVQVGFSGILRGIHDTKVPLIMTSVCYWGVGIPVGYILSGEASWTAAWGLPVMGVRGWWLGLIFALTLAATMLGLRVRARFWGKESGGQTEHTEKAEQAEQSEQAGQASG